MTLFSLVAGLQERLGRISRAPNDAYGHEVRYLRDYILSTPRLRDLVSALDSVDIDPVDWVSRFSEPGYSWPQTESQRAKVLWYVIGEIADAEDPWKVSLWFSGA